MHRRSILFVLLTAGIVVAALYLTGNALGTPANGFVGTTLAKGRLDEIDIFNKLVDPPDAQTQGNNGNVWLSLQKTKGSSDLYVQTNVWQPGGTTGWHSHPGHSLIVVTAGTVTDYEGDDPTCTPHVYTTGMAFVDHGGEHHVHIIRNETNAVAATVAIQLIPADTQRRIDVPTSPGNCSF
jgi:quercetin dioxygenase-like cupin family protein